MMQGDVKPSFWFIVTDKTNELYKLRKKNALTLTIPVPLSQTRGWISSSAIFYDNPVQRKWYEVEGNYYARSN